MGMDGPEEAGLLAALELFILGSTKPIGYAVLEIDTKNDRYSFMLGVDIQVSNFLEDAPDWLDEIAKISGTLFISNDPGTVAIGRLSDERKLCRRQQYRIRGWSRHCELGSGPL